MDSIIDNERDAPVPEQVAPLYEAYTLAVVGWPLLAVYALAQAGLSFVIAPQHPDLKLVFEPYLLMLGLILHVHWRRVDRIFRVHDLPRPVWIVMADCLSFVITFWALATLLEALVHELR